MGDIIKDSNSKIDLYSIPNSSKFSKSMRQMIGSLMNSRNSLNINQDEYGRETILGKPIQLSEGDTIKIKENIYELSQEIYKALIFPTYTGKTMKNKNDSLRMYNIIRDVGYTSIGDKSSKRKTFFTIKLPKLVEEIQNKTFEEIIDDSSDLEGRGIEKFIIPSNIVDI